jgi:hypothetical protein
MEYTVTALQLAGLGQFALLGVAAAIPKVLDWRGNLARVHPCMRQLVWVYGLYIFMIVSAFALLSVALPHELVSGTMLARAVCGFITAFWAVRLVVQLCVFDMASVMPRAWMRMGYHSLTGLFVALVSVYAWAAFVG